MLNITWVGTPNFRRLILRRKKFIVMHWMVGDLESTDKRFRDRKSRVSTQFGVEGARVHQYVHQKDYAFGSGTWYANRYGISIEHAGGWLDADGHRVKPSHATHETSAQLCARIARRWGWGELKVGKNVFRHSDFKATQCPGSLDVEWIVKRANEINRARSA